MEHPLFCDRFNKALTDPENCINCDLRVRNITKNYISCPHIKLVDNPSVNTVLPINEEFTTTMIRVDENSKSPAVKEREAKEKEKREKTRLAEAEAKSKEDDAKAAKELEKTTEDNERSVWDDSITLTRNPAFQLPKRAYLIEVKD